jgi:hypothetical protein
MRKEDERKKGERIISAFKKKYDGDGQVCILWSSEDSELARYFNYQCSLGSTHQEPDGKIFVKLHDADPRRQMLKATVLEELGHALQYKQRGNISITRDNSERKERELEVAKCMINRFDQRRLKLSADDIEHYRSAIEFYGQD